MIHMENRNTETIKMMYLEDRPYEKCEQYGAEHLTDVELLAVLLRTGTKGENSLRLAQKILHPPFGSEGLLSIPTVVYGTTAEDQRNRKGKIHPDSLSGRTCKTYGESRSLTGIGFFLPGQYCTLLYGGSSA